MDRVLGEATEVSGIFSSISRFSPFLEISILSVSAFTGFFLEIILLDVSFICQDRLCCFE